MYAESNVRNETAKRDPVGASMYVEGRQVVRPSKERNEKIKRAWSGGAGYKAVLRKQNNGFASEQRAI